MYNATTYLKAFAGRRRRSARPPGGPAGDAAGRRECAAFRSRRCSRWPGCSTTIRRCARSRPGGTAKALPTRAAIAGRLSRRTPSALVGRRGELLGDVVEDAGVDGDERGPATGDDGLALGREVDELALDEQLAALAPGEAAAAGDRSVQRRRRLVADRQLAGERGLLDRRRARTRTRRRTGRRRCRRASGRARPRGRRAASGRPRSRRRGGAPRGRRPTATTARRTGARRSSTIRSPSATGCSQRSARVAPRPGGGRRPSSSRFGQVVERRRRPRRSARRRPRGRRAHGRCRGSPGRRAPEPR